MEIGDTVRHRYTESVGIVMEVHSGVNALAHVLFEGKEFYSLLPISDLIILEDNHENIH